MDIRWSDFAKMSAHAKVFLITEVFFGFSSGLLSVHLNFFYRSVGLDSVAIGNIGLAGSIVTMAGALLAGRFAGRKGYLPVCLIGSAMQGLGIVFMAALAKPYAAIMGYIVYTVGLTFVHAVEFPYLMRICGERQRHTAYYNLILIYSLSAILGNLAGEWIRGSGVWPNGEYRLSLLVSGVGFLLLSAVRLRLKREYPSDSAQTIRFRPLLRRPAIRNFLLYQILFSVSAAVLNTQLNLIYREVFGFADAKVSQLYSFATLLTLCALILLPGVTRRAPVNVASYLALGISVGVYLLCISAIPALCVTMILLRGALSQVFPVLFDSRMLNALSQSDHAGYTSMRVLGSSLGSGIGAALTGWLLTYCGFRVLMIAGALVAISVFVVYARGCRSYLRE